jgi:hypothetical protein
MIENTDEFSFIIDFRGNEVAEDITIAEGFAPLGFVIIRNNTYSQSKDLLDWLSTKDAKSLSFVEAEKLQKLLKGEFESGEIGFSQWKNIQRIKENLERDKQNFSYSVINVTIMLIGIFLIVVGVVIIFVYFFDIANSFTDLSLLEFITHGRIYPIASKGELEYLKHIKNSKFVTIKDILIISVVLWTIGGLFLENYVILEFFGSIYIKIMDLIGGGA